MSPKQLLSVSSGISGSLENLMRWYSSYFFFTKQQLLGTRKSTFLSNLYFSSPKIALLSGCPVTSQGTANKISLICNIIFVFDSVGLENTANNCFLNAVLQVLRATHNIREVINQHSCDGMNFLCNSYLAFGADVAPIWVLIL